MGLKLASSHRSKTNEVRRILATKFAFKVTLKVNKSRDEVEIKVHFQGRKIVCAVYGETFHDLVKNVQDVCGRIVRDKCISARTPRRNFKVVASAR